MVENFKISCSLIFGDFANEIYYDYDVVYTQDSIKEKGYIVGTNFAVITGKIIDKEGLLGKFYCDESKWNGKMSEFVSLENAKFAIELFEERKKFL